MAEGISGLCRIRLVVTGPNGREITNDLPHPHQGTFTVVAFQPGNPSSTAIGSFTLPLFPPGSDQYMAAKAIYDQLDYYQRLEWYISPDGASLANLKYAGIITGIEKVEGEGGDVLQLTGVSDLAFANLSRPFPGELLSNDLTSAILKSYLGRNEAGWMDTFNVFTPANYTSTSLPGFAAGTWSAATDDGFNVVSCSTGTPAVLLAQTGASANDRWHSQYVEVTGRLSPSSDGTNAGIFGVGLSKSNANCNDCVYGYAQAYKVGGRWSISAWVNHYTGGVGGTSLSVTNALGNVDDPQGMIPLTVGLLWTTGGNGNATPTVSLTINGKVVIGQYATGIPDPGTATVYPFLLSEIAATGNETGYFMNLAQITRFTTDGPSTAALFGNGAITASPHSLAYGVDPGPSFLEAWGRLATREGWYWRYTPQPYVVGSRTLGTVDFAPDPGTDRSTSCIFKRRLGNLLSVRLTGNADRFVSDTAVSGQSTLDGGGIGYWRDIGSMTKYGVLQDEALAFTHSDFNSLRRQAYQIVQNKINLSAAGSKTAIVLRDAETVDQWRELDKILIDDPDIGISNLIVRVIGYTFTEGDVKQTVTLDQFSEFTDGTIPIKRLQQTIYETAASMNRYAGSGGGTAMIPLASQGSFAGGSLGAYSTANSTTWTDIAGTSFVIQISRPALFEYRIFATCRITAGAGSGYVRGSIVGYDNTASPFFAGSDASNGMIWYYPSSKGPIQPGQYTVKLQAATDNGTTITVDQGFHQFFLLGA